MSIDPSENDLAMMRVAVETQRRLANGGQEQRCRPPCRISASSPTTSRVGSRLPTRSCCEGMSATGSTRSGRSMIASISPKSWPQQLRPWVFRGCRRERSINRTCRVTRGLSVLDSSGRPWAALSNPSYGLTPPASRSSRERSAIRCAR
jgi:hypothetical protein